MKPSPLLLMLDALLGLVEQQLERETADPAADLPLVGAELQRLTALLVRLSERTAAHVSGEISFAAVDAILATRRLRGELLGPDIGDSAWELLLTLYAARLKDRRQSVTRLAESAGLYLSTALRWIHRFRARGWVDWQADPEDARAALIGLSDLGAGKVESYLRAALQGSQLVL